MVGKYTGAFRVMKPHTVHLDHMDGFEFEELCKEIIEKTGFPRVERTPAVGDEGRDLIIHDDYGLIFVECKHHPNSSIGRPDLQKLHSALITGGAVQGWFITSGRFAGPAVKHVKKLSPPITLIDRQMLFDMANKVGMELVIGGKTGTMYSYPIVSDDQFKWNLGAHLKTFLNSSPHEIPNMLDLRERAITMKPIFAIDYRVDSSFRTSIGLIHREREVRGIC